GFREAFAHVRRHRQPRDVLWVSQPEVFEVYFRGRETCLGSFDDSGKVVKQARGGRLWLISNRPRPHQFERQLHEAGFALLSATSERRGSVSLTYAPREREKPSPGPHQAANIQRRGPPFDRSCRSACSASSALIRPSPSVSMRSKSARVPSHSRRDT